MGAFFTSTLEETIAASTTGLPTNTRKVTVKSWFDDYLEASPSSTNQGSAVVPFQRWFKFKEAFSPKFVADTINSMAYEVDRVVDPFGGSGTTALTCRMLGIRSVTTEVNPFLSDLIRSKLCFIDPDQLRQRYERIKRKIVGSDISIETSETFPKTMCEPGVKGRWIFPKDVFRSIVAVVRELEQEPDDVARLIKVLVGSNLIPCSNVRINGKGRRYRSNWQSRQCSAAEFWERLDQLVDIAADDLDKFRFIPKGDHVVLTGDCRSALKRVRSADLAIFSPPYPNSFDYTDVYNVELWMLGYLSTPECNRALRQNTLRSHVQTKWQKEEGGETLGSALLQKTLKLLDEARDQLWDQNIPSMVDYYFRDLIKVLSLLNSRLPMGHHAVVAIGDSKYAGIHIDVALILDELSHQAGFVIESSDSIRSMRTSSQHGGALDLSEHCLVFKKTSELSGES